MKNIDFIAELKFLTTEQSGRKTRAKSGYRPHIEFDNYPEYITSGIQTYIGKETVFPGETIKAQITILGTEYFAKRLYENMDFKFCEGSRTIGYGKIKEIVNLDLKSEPNVSQESINLNLFPFDMKNRIESDFGENRIRAISRIQELIISNESFRNHRIIRAIIHLANKDSDHLKKIIGQAKTDWRDILLWAEYKDENGKTTQIRDFNKEFGNETL
ncbi:elongation factor Tu [Zobellia nedashkovskayae]|uniref:elongation factor Tu n=1 Tax=Zobellia nedashkovskayae TaxID=2779510 RepID=UPI00188D3E40|nr:elongation factor Tu [Zobellia nedashkovskayae]